MKQTPEELFAGFQPDLGNKEKYMADFSKKLEAAEVLRRACEESARRSRRNVLLAAFSGFVAGGFLVAFILLYPSFGTDLYAKFTLGLISISFNKLVCVSLFLAAIPLSLYFLLPDTK